MAARKPKAAEPQTAPISRSGILRAIGDALTEWAGFAGKEIAKDIQRSPAAREVARKAMTLMRDNLPLLLECKARYGLHGGLRMVFECLEQAASWPDTRDLGGCWNWGETYFTQSVLSDGAKRSFVDEVGRWADKEQAGEPAAMPQDLKNLDVASRTLGVSRSWLQARIRHGLLTSYRRGDTGPHLVSMAEADALARLRRPE